MNPFGLRLPVSTLLRTGDFDRTLFAKKTSYKIFRLKNIHTFASLYPFLPHDLIESKLAERWNQIPQKEKDKYYTLVLRKDKKEGKRRSHKKKGLTFVPTAGKKRPNKKKQKKIFRADSSNDEEDMSDGVCSDLQDSPSDESNHFLSDAMIPDVHSPDPRARKTKGKERKLAQNKARIETRAGQATRRSFESVDDFYVGLNSKLECKRPSKRKGQAMDEVAEWLIVEQRMQRKTYTDDCLTDCRTPDVIGEQSRPLRSSIRKSTASPRRLQDRGDQGRSKVTFSKRQKVHLEEGGEFSCDAGISDDKEDTSSSQEFEKGTYSVGITWDRYRKQGVSHEYPALNIVKNPSSHPLQQVQKGRGYSMGYSVNSDSTDMNAELLTPDTVNKSREPFETPRKNKPSFKKNDKTGDPRKEKKWHNQLFADQNNNSQEEFQEKENKQAKPLILKKGKKTKRSSNVSKTRKTLGRDTPVSPSDENGKYEDDIHVQGYDSDIELTPVRPLKIPQTPSPSLSSSSSFGTLKSSSPQTPLSGIVPFSETTPSDTSSPQVKCTPRQDALPMQQTNLCGSPQVTRPASGKSKTTATAAQTPKSAPGTRRRRVLKLYNPEPLLSSVNSQTSLCSQGSPPIDLSSDDSDSEESSNPLSDAEGSNTNHEVHQDASSSEDNNKLQEMDKMVCEEGGSTEVTEEMECEETDWPAVENKTSEEESHQRRMKSHLIQTEDSDVVDITDMEEVHREEDAGSDPMDDLEYYDLTPEDPVNSKINDKTHQIVLDLFTDDGMPPPGKRYLLGGSQEYYGNSSNSCDWDEDLYG